MSRTLVVGAAPVPGHDRFYRELLADATHVVAADAAGEWCVALGRVPDVVVGDFDGSLEGAADRLRELGARVEIHPVAKDATDLELAVDRAVACWADPVVLTAAFTARVDHTLAAFGALGRAGRGASACEPSWSARVALPGSPVTVGLAAGTPVSVLSLRGRSIVDISGAEWPLGGAPMEELSGLGISNRASGGPLTVSVTNGIVVVIVLELA